jgi:hypothetical protein
MESTGQKTVEEFVATSRAFCDWAENPPRKREEDFEIALRLLPRLYCFALELRESGGDETEVTDIPHEKLSTVYHRFGNLPVNAYAECFNALVVPPEEPCIGSLMDDLGDIYHDVKRGLLHFDAGHIEQAIWFWQFHFRHHWGRHLVGALRALHCHAESNFLWPHLYCEQNEQDHCQWKTS